MLAEESLMAPSWSCWKVVTRIYKWMNLWRLHPFVHCNMECMEIMYWLLCLLQMYILGD